MAQHPLLRSERLAVSVVLLAWVALVLSSLWPTIVDDHSRSVAWVVLS